MVCVHNIKRHKTYKVKVGNTYIGGDSPVLVQSMTNTDTSDVEATTQQVIELYEAGSEVIRLTVNNEQAASAVPKIYEKLLARNYDVPLVGCFHYNGHKLLTEFQECAQALAKYRINPGNVGFGEKRDKHFEMMINQAIKYIKPVRIGVNWGSLDQDLAQKLMDDNAKLAAPKSSDELLREAIVTSSLTSAERAINLGLPADMIIISCKVSQPQDLIAVYRELARRSNFALHLGLTEAGIGTKGIVATTAALSVLLQEGIGDTIRASLTPRPNEPRTQEVIVCREILQALNIRIFTPQVTACPGCGRTTSTYFQQLASDIQDFLNSSMPVWKNNYEGVETLRVAVMGCIVNGPGESKHADIGISLPGTGESPVAPVFIDGEKAHTLRGDKIAEEFKEIVLNYIEHKYSKKLIMA